MSSGSELIQGGKVLKFKTKSGKTTEEREKQKEY